MWLAEPHTIVPSHIPKAYICTGSQAVRQSVRQVGQYIRVWVVQGGKAGCVWAPSSLVSAAALLKWQELLQLRLLLLLLFWAACWWWSVVVQVAGWACSGCHARGRIRTAHLLEARLTQHVHFTQPPFRHAAEIRVKGLRSTFGVVSPCLPANPAGQAQPSFGPSPFCSRREARG